MSKSQIVIPISKAASAATACSSGPVDTSSGTCSSASSCSSGSSCSAGGAADSNDPTVKLAREGWILRTTIGEPRLSEVVENYRAMGYEVHVERYGDSGGDCTTCFDAADKTDEKQAWGSVYVRPGKPVTKDDELF